MLLIKTMQNSLPYTHFYVPNPCTIFGTCRKKKQDLFNAMGSMYAAILFIGVQNATSVQPVVSIERTVFYRERAAGMYSALPYAFGQVLYVKIQQGKCK